MKPRAAALSLSILFLVLHALPALAAQADLSVASMFSASTNSIGELVTIELMVTNLGPSTATNVRLTNSVPTNASVFSVTLSQGSVLATNPAVVCDLGAVSVGSNVSVSMLFVPQAAGSLVSISTMSANETDIHPGNNSATNTVLVVPVTLYPGPMLNVARGGHTATVLPDGRILIAGGSGAGTSAEIYDPQTKTFSLTGNMTIARSGHAATLLQDGTVLITGGFTAGSLLTAEIYNPASGQFTAIGNMNNIHIEHTATLLQDGRVLVEGDSYTFPINAAEIYVPALHGFTNINGTLYGGSRRMSFRLANGKVLLPGGTVAQGFNPSGSSDYFDPALNQFAALPPTQRTRSYYGGVPLLDGRILIAAGNESPQTAEFYYTNSQTFVLATNTLRTIHYFATANRLSDGKVLIAGWSAQPDLFDPANDSFSRTVDMITARQGFTATTLSDGTVLIVGGIASASFPAVSYLSTTEIYDPMRTKPPPAISITGSSVPEGNSGTTNLLFSVTLSSAMGVPVSVGFATASGSASDGEDFIGTNGTLVFPPGVTNLTLPVAVIGDLNYEVDETFTVTLSGATNAAIDMLYATATGTILNDDDFPTANVLPAAVVEGNVRTTNLVFHVQLQANSYLPAYVSYATANGTGQAGIDYLATNGSLVFQPGVTNLTLTVAVKGDTVVEPDETFLVTLNSPTNLVIGSPGTGTILNDDGLPGLVDHFEFTTNESLQFAARPMGITISAKDAFNNVVTNFSGPVALSGSTSNTPSYKFEFEEPDFSVWTALNAGPNPGPYIFKLLDLPGVGVPSMAFGLTPNPDPVDGITRNILLQGGVPYFISVAIARANEGGSGYGPDTSVYLQANGAMLSSYSFATSIFPGQLQRTNLSGTFTPPTNGFYPINILMDRSFGENGDIKAYADDVKVAYPRLTPDWTAAFTNGVWVGTLLASAPATNYVLHAEDYYGHSGDSAPLAILNNADLSVQSSVVTATPRVGSDVVITFTVTNSGIGMAPNVVLTNILSGDFTIRSVTASQGVCTTNGNTITCPLGILTNHQAVTVTQTIRSSSISFVTNAAMVTSDLIDPVAANNSLTTVVTINPPLIFASNISILEGDTGSSNAVVPLSLGGASSQTISVNYATLNGTAQAGSDYTAVSGSVTFAPGVTNQTVAVPILGDLLNEANETLTLQLSNPTNAALNQSSATITIMDNDPLPAISISDTSVLEGDSGTTSAVFQVTLSAPSGRSVSFGWHTADGTATFTNDYVVVTQGGVTFSPGLTNSTLSVSVRGDTVNEPDETFFVLLTNASNATFARSNAVGTILNDDLVHSRLDHFTWSSLESLQIRNQPIPVAITARDAFNSPVTNYTGTVPLSATGKFAATVSPTSISGFTNGVWNGSISFVSTNSNVVVTVDDGQQHVGQSGLFGVVTLFPLTLTAPALAHEGDGVLTNGGHLTVAAPRFSDISFALSSTNTNRVVVPASVLLAAGQTSAVFNITLVDDRVAEGSQTNLISATATNYVVATAAMVVGDPGDSDGDGIPDWWVTQYFGHTNGQASDNSRAQDSAAGDGITNLQKYRASKNPLLWDNLHFVNFGTMPGGFFKLTVFGQVNSNYTLQGSTNLLTWASLFTFVCTNTSMDLLDSNAANYPARLYRLSPTAPPPP